MATAKTTKKVTRKADEVKTIDRLREELATKLTDQLAAKRSHKQGELVNPRVLTITRKEIARLHTAIRAAEIASAKESK